MSAEWATLCRLGVGLFLHSGHPRPFSSGEGTVSRLPSQQAACAKPWHGVPLLLWPRSLALHFAFIGPGSVCLPLTYTCLACLILFHGRLKHGYPKMLPEQVALT